MASFPLVCSYGFLTKQGKWKLHVGNSTTLSRCRIVLALPKCSYASASLPFLGLSNSCCTFHCRLLCCSTKIRSLVNKDSDVDTRIGKGETYGLRRKFKLRLRPRLRLLSIRLKMVSVKSVLNNFGMVLRKNMRRVTLSASVSIVLGLCFLFLKITAMPTPKVVPYSDFTTSLECGTVTKVQFEEGTRRIFYNTNSCSGEDSQKGEDKLFPSTGNVAANNAKNVVVTRTLLGANVFSKMSKGRASTFVWQFSTRKIDHDESYLLSLMREKGTTYGSAPQSALMLMRSMLIMVLSLWIPLTPLMWLLYRQLSAANSTSRKRRPSNQVVSFDELEGVDAAKVELMEIVLCLRGSIDYSRLGAKLPRGVLLVGPPGTGKTLLARAVAGEAGVPFFSVSASEFVELFVGRGASRIRDLFSVARKNAPSIIFIDELDAVGGKRGRSFNDERDQTLNQLLTEMDGFDSNMNIVVIAATNRPEALDPALCRPGRFSRKIYVGEPDEEGRRKILAVHMREVPLEEETDIICNLVASLTQGLVGADLANIVNEAALLAARKGADSVSREDIMEAIERAKFGIRDRQSGAGTISQELGKLFPWMPSLIARKNDTRGNGIQELGYQSLS